MVYSVVLYGSLASGLSYKDILILHYIPTKLNFYNQLKVALSDSGCKTITFSMNYKTLWLISVFFTTITVHSTQQNFIDLQKAFDVWGHYFYRIEKYRRNIVQTTENICRESKVQTRVQFKLTHPITMSNGIKQDSFIESTATQHKYGRNHKRNIAYVTGEVTKCVAWK